MKSKATFWQKIGLHDWFLTKEATAATQQIPTLTPNDVYKYIVQKFNESIAQLSFANRIVFFHEYIICFNPEDYNQFMDNKRGIFGIDHSGVRKAVLRYFKNIPAAGKNS